MAFLENVLLALSGLKTSKMRSFLTMLGIIIGIGSVIGIMTVGDSVTGSVTSMMNDLGANNIEIDVSEIPDEFGNYTYDDIPEDSLLTDDMLEQYQELFKGRVRGDRRRPADHACRRSAGKRPGAERRSDGHHECRYCSGPLPQRAGG